MSGCSCARCRSRLPVRQLAPRLALAHDQLLAEAVEMLRKARESYGHGTHQLLRAERNMHHRELQLLRSRERDYAARRHRKLDAAKAEVEELKQRVEGRSRMVRFWQARVAELRG